MQAKQESDDIKHKGVILTSETPEDIQMLLGLWLRQCQPVEFQRYSEFKVAVTIAPLVEENNEFKKGE